MVISLGNAHPSSSGEFNSVSLDIANDVPAGADVFLWIGYYNNVTPTTTIDGASWDSVVLVGYGQSPTDGNIRVGLLRAKASDAIDSGTTLTAHLTGVAFAVELSGIAVEGLEEADAEDTVFFGDLSDPGTITVTLTAVSGETLAIGSGWLNFRTNVFDPADGTDEVQDYVAAYDGGGFNTTHALITKDGAGAGDVALGGTFTTSNAQGAFAFALFAVAAEDATPPVATVTTPPSETTIDQAMTTTFEFRANEAIQAWKVEVVADHTAEHDEGTVIGTSNGSLNVTGGALDAMTDQSVTIHGADLDAASPGAGPKVVKVFAQDLAGNWSAL